MEAPLSSSFQSILKKPKAFLITDLYMWPISLILEAPLCFKIKQWYILFWTYFHNYYTIGSFYLETYVL